jgi:hypothetical protein
MCRPDPSFFVAPSHPFFVPPRALPEGSLGACAPRKNTVGGCCPEATFFVAPSGLFCRPERSFSLSPRAPFPCRPEASAEGSLGACAPRDDMPGRRSERSEGCLAIAQQDGVGNFLNSLRHN